MLATLVLRSLAVLSFMTSIAVLYVLIQKVIARYLDDRARRLEEEFESSVYQIWNEELGWRRFGHRVHRSNMRIARRTIVRLAQSLRGDMKQSLQVGYAQLGFLEDDVHLLEHGRLTKRMAALNRLQVMGNPSLIRKMLKVLHRDRSPVIRARAARLLLSLGYNDPKPFFVAFCQETQMMAYVHADTLIHLGKLVSDYLVSFVRDHPATPKAGLAVRVLGEMGSLDLVPTLIEWTQSSHLGLRINAVWSLGNVASEEVKPTLLEALSDDNDTVRAFAIRGLVPHVHEGDKEWLQRLLIDPDVQVRRYANDARRQLERIIGSSQMNQRGGVL